MWAALYISKYVPYSIFIITIWLRAYATATSSSTIITLSTCKHINVDQYDNDTIYCNSIK